jgi:hypothetical protein
MIVKDSEGKDYLNLLRTGKLEKGYEIGCELDNYLVFKRKQLVFANGLDNVGKTYFIAWYFLCLTQRHNLTWTIFSTENSIAKIKRDLIQFLAQRKVEDLTEMEFYNYFNHISHYFKFLSTDVVYNFEEVLKLFNESNTDGYLIDPLTALANGAIKINKHETDNENMLKLRAWLNTNNKTVYINTHVSTEAARRTYPKDHDLNGHTMPPTKADTEGGQKLANRADDFITIHRLTQHEIHWMNTQVHVRKVKDTLTGGGTTMLDYPVSLKHEKNFSFTVGGINPLTQKAVEPEEEPQLTDISKMVDDNFDNNINPF